MKGFALVLLCVVAAAQARSTGVDTSRSAAALGENPWLVHLRVAVSTSGRLSTCAGTLIDGRWVLTSASCLADARFIWVRYGAVDVISPQLVTEVNNARLFVTHPAYDSATGENDIALLDLNRYVLNPPNEAIATISLAAAGSELPASAKFCNYGTDEYGSPGDFLTCVNVAPNAQEDGSISADAESTRFDFGSPLVHDGVQYGILTKAGESSSFLNPAAYLDWIQQETGIGSDADGDDNGDADGDDNGEVDAINDLLTINFVN